MRTRQFEAQHLMRAVILAAFIATLALAFAAPRGVGAEGDSSQNATTQIQVCEAMGGEADVYSDMSSNHYTVIVECNGGYMDGFNCINDTDSSGSFTDCTQTRYLSLEDDYKVGRDGEIKPLDEPANSGPVVDTGAVSEQVEPVVIDQPTGGEETATSTPDSDDGGNDGGDGGAGGDGVIVVDPVLTDPVVSDGGGDAAPEPTTEPTKGEVIIDRDPLIKDPSILEPIILDDPLAPPVEKVQDVEIK